MTRKRTLGDSGWAAASYSPVSSRVTSRFSDFEPVPAALGRVDFTGLGWLLPEIAPKIVHSNPYEPMKSLLGANNGKVQL